MLRLIDVRSVQAMRDPEDVACTSGVSERYIIIAALSEWWGEFRLREGLCWWCGGAVPPCCPSRGSPIPHAALAHLARR